MPEASRIGDTTLHGGAIVQGAKLVIIGGFMAARKGDSYICPIHGTGVIIQGAEQVIIEGAKAARKLDKCGCAVIGVSGTGVPPTVGAEPLQWSASANEKERGKMDAQLDDDEPARGPHIEGEVLDSDKDGTRDTVRGEASGVRMRNQAYGDVGPVEFGAKHNLDVFPNNLDVFYGRGQLGSTVDGQGWIPGIGASGSGEAGMLKQGGEILVGPAGDKGLNPYQSIGGEYNLFHAEAKGDVLLGDDGRRVGIVGSGKASADTASIKGISRQSIPIPFTNWTIEQKGELEVAAGSVGGGAGGWLYYDKGEGRFHFGGFGEVKALFGGELNLDISIGRKYEPPPAPTVPPSTPSTPGIGEGGIPNALAFGHPMVLIGG